MMGTKSRAGTLATWPARAGIKANKRQAAAQVVFIEPFFSSDEIPPVIVQCRSLPGHLDADVFDFVDAQFEQGGILVQLEVGLGRLNSSRAALAIQLFEGENVQIGRA